MAQTEFKPHKISKGIQLPGFWLAAIILITGALLLAAANIEEPSWVRPLLVIVTVFVIVVGLIAVFLLQTKFRPHLQDDKYYNEWLSTVTSRERPEKDTIPLVVESEELKEVKCNQQSVIINEKSNRENHNLFLKARINFKYDAGSASLMRVKVNNELLIGADLVNKPPMQIIADSRAFKWFDDYKKSWRVVFSPNFNDNYFHSKYKVVNGDPYIFIFDLSRIGLTGENKYKVVVEHIGNLHGDDSHDNSIIIKDASIF